MQKVVLIVAFVLGFHILALGQKDLASDQQRKRLLDSAYIAATESKKASPKVLHAEPLYIDLIRDLGARKGEREWNVGFGMTDRKDYDAYAALVEYEFAPANRWGLEFELPFTFYSSLQSNNATQPAVPSNQLDAIKLATQYTFLVSEPRSISLAVGYIHEFSLTGFANYGKDPLMKGQEYNPFFVAAKRWGNHFHTLLYTGPVISQSFKENEWQSLWQINANFHYMVPGTRNFLGVECNHELSRNEFELVIRPQMRLEITEQLMIGIVSGIPINRSEQGFSAFARIIYEPAERPKLKRH